MVYSAYTDTQKLVVVVVVVVVGFAQVTSSRYIKMKNIRKSRFELALVVIARTGT